MWLRRRGWDAHGQPPKPFPLLQGHSISASFEPPSLSPSQLATIVYTSGTTGNPKVCTAVAARSQGRIAVPEHVVMCCCSAGAQARYKLPDVRVQGVMLSHANLRYQVDNMGRYINLKAGDKSLSLLPPWHMYERACSYYMLRCACCQVRP